MRCSRHISPMAHVNTSFKGVVDARSGAEQRVRGTQQCDTVNFPKAAPESGDIPAKEYVSQWATSLMHTRSGVMSTESLRKRMSDSAQAQDSRQPVLHGRPTISKHSLPKGHHTVEEVAAWFANLGFDDVALQVQREEVDGEAVVLFSDRDFQNLGLKWGVAKKLALWICEDRVDCVGVVGLRPREVDSSLVLGAERTLYAAQQMGWNIIFVGMGLMMATTDDQVPNTCGMVSIVGGIAFIIASWLFHLKRLRDFSVPKQVSLLSSTVFTLGCTFLFIIVVSTELYFGAIYPYLLRTKQVEINN